MNRPHSIQFVPLAPLAAALLLATTMPVMAGDSGDRTDALDVAAGSVETGETPMGSELYGTAEDIRMHAVLEAKLAESDQLSALMINTDVQDGIVNLRGDVETESQRALAEELALTVSGVRGVENELDVTHGQPTVAEQVASEATDVAITASVKTRLLASDHTSGLKIDVDTEDEVVTLTGEVDSETERELAGLIALNTSGVNDVVNRLMVASR
jgi:osmotically-inducible protein OsmY